MVFGGGCESAWHRQCLVLGEWEHVAQAVFGDSGKPPSFGQTLATAAARSWIEAAVWSPSGEVVAFASHDSRVSVMTMAMVT